MGALKLTVTSYNVKAKGQEANVREEKAVNIDRLFSEPDMKRRRYK
jgi:hypothetical protein